MPAWSSELKYLMNQHINKGCGIRKTMSTKRAKMPQIRNPGKKALIIALVKLGLYKAPTSYDFCLFSSSLFHSNSSLLPRTWDSASDEILYRSSLLIFLFEPVDKKGFSHLRIEKYMNMFQIKIEIIGYTFSPYNIPIQICHIPKEYFR